MSSQSKEDFEVDVVHVEDSTSDSTESLQVKLIIIC